MRKSLRLSILLGVLVVVCAAAALISRQEEKKEQIKNSGEIILTIPTEDVTSLAWENENGRYSFTKSQSWTYDADSAFPVDEEKINAMLEPFQQLSAAFVIEEVEDYAQYGLDKPVCTVSVAAGEETYDIQLGDYSKMDEQRYISIGDGNVYLVFHDPLDEFSAVFSDLILDDTLPEWDNVENITFSGVENYSITYDEDAAVLCDDDVYFTNGKPLDSSNVNGYLNTVRSLDLSGCVSYNVTDDELSAWGLAEPELSIMLEYVRTDTDGEITDSGILTLHLGRNQKEQAAYEKAVEDQEENLPSVTYYVRVGDSQIIYSIPKSSFDKLINASYNKLRHQMLFTASVEDIASIDVTLEGESYTFTHAISADNEESDDDETWTYQDESFDAGSLCNALRSLTAHSFTEEKSNQNPKEEIRLTVYLDNESFPTVAITLYRHDGETCLAEVDGEPCAMVLRNQAVDLIEAVNAIVLQGSEN